jgi:hypothetical protein
MADEGMDRARGVDADATKERIARARRSLVLWIPCTVFVWFALSFVRRSFEGSPGPVAGSLMVAAALFPLAMCLSKIHSIVMGYVGLAVHGRARK